MNDPAKLVRLRAFLAESLDDASDDDVDDYLSATLGDPATVVHSLRAAAQRMTHQARVEEREAVRSRITTRRQSNRTRPSRTRAQLRLRFDELIDVFPDFASALAFRNGIGELSDSDLADLVDDLETLAEPSVDETES